jgi:hypothetical protein
MPYVYHTPSIVSFSHEAKIMTVLIENLLGKPIWVQRNNGRSLNISPGGRLVEVSDTEWKTNPTLKKLETQGALRARPPHGNASSGEGSQAARTKVSADRPNVGGSGRSAPQSEKKEKGKP